jgi:hypothetical protein
MHEAQPLFEINACELSENKFALLAAKRHPCVIRGAISHWPALKKWRDKAYLGHLGRACCVAVLSDHGHLAAAKPNSNLTYLPFPEALGVLQSEQMEVARLVDKRDGFAKFLNGDLGDFPFLKKRPTPAFFPAIRYFIYRNSGTSWHAHGTDETLMCQIVGAKKVGILQWGTLHSEPMKKFFGSEDYYRKKCSIDVGGSAAHKWYYACVEEGDALYIPPSWWHGVEPVSKGFGITAAVCWRCHLPLISDFSLPATKELWKLLLSKMRRRSFDRYDCTTLLFLSASAVAQVLFSILPFFLKAFTTARTRADS